MSNQEFFIAIPSFSVEGDPLPNNVLDSIVETLEIPINDLNIIESNPDFFVIINNNPINFFQANQNIELSNQLKETYSNSISKLTKLLRISDKISYQIKKSQLEFLELQKKNEELKNKLIFLENQKTNQLELIKSVELELNNVINNFKN